MSHRALSIVLCKWCPGDGRGLNNDTDGGGVM